MDNFKRERYGGIGAGANAKGSRAIPFSLKLYGEGAGDQDYLAGALLSCELEHSDNMCLLSQNAQSVLGIVRDQRDGTAFLKDYNQYVQLYRIKSNGLVAMCISDFASVPSPIPSAPQAVAGDLAPGAIPEVPDAAPTDTSAGALAPGATTVLQCSMQLATSEERNAAFARVTVGYATVPFRT